MNPLRISVLALLVMSATVQAVPPPIVCMPQPVACGPQTLDRLDPAVQRQLVEQQLSSQPNYWTTVYFYLPPLDDGALEQLQIRYLEELLARHKAKASAAEPPEQADAAD
jgi:hypothetical protein